MDLTFASCEHSMEDRRQMRNDAWTLAKSFAIFISPNWSVSCHSKRNDSIYILKICCRPFVCLFIFSANLYSRRGGIWISLVSVAFCLRGDNARFQGRGGEVKYQVCVHCACCVLLRVVVGAGVKYQGKRSNDTNCEVHPKSPPMFNSWVSSFGKFSILCFPPNSSPSHWTDTWHHCPF